MWSSSAAGPYIYTDLGVHVGLTPHTVPQVTRHFMKKRAKSPERLQMERDGGTYHQPKRASASPRPLVRDLTPPFIFVGGRAEGTVSGDALGSPRTAAAGGVLAHTTRGDSGHLVRSTRSASQSVVIRAIVWSGSP